MPTVQEIGAKVGDYFLVIKEDSFPIGAIVQLYCDDGTDCVQFQLIKSRRKSVAAGIIRFEELGYMQHLPGYDPQDPENYAAAPPSVLEEAQQIIYGDREETYGDPGKNLRHIAEQWSLYLHQKYSTPIGLLSAEDVCYMMADLKKCRQLHKPKRDNIVDGIGYLALTERL